MTTAQGDINERMLTLTAEDGFTLEAFRATPKEGSKGGLVIIQEIFGMTDQLKSVVRSYAADGYDTILPAMYDRIAPNTVVPFSEADLGRETMMKLDPANTLKDIAAAVKAVDGGKGVSVLGFCWGGGQAIRAAYHLQIAGAIAFYGTALKTHITTERQPNCPTLFHYGETDTHSPPDVIEAVRETIPQAETYLYAAGHAFANDARPTHVPEAAALARERTIAFLGKVHGG